MLPNGFAALKRFAADANSRLEPSWQALLILVLRGTALRRRPSRSAIPSLEGRSPNQPQLSAR
jgi:hypothetical protein